MPDIKHMTTSDGGAWSIKKGAEASEKGVSAKCTILKNLYRVFLWYRFVKYQENTNDTEPNYRIEMQL